MTDGSWSDYVAEAGTDPTALSDASGSMADAIGAADSGFDSIDTSTLAEAAANDVASAATNVDGRRAAPPPVAPLVAAPPLAVPLYAYQPATQAWPTPSSVPMGSPPPGKSGKQCQTCRRDFPSLWRVVIGTPAGFEERFICGTSVTCQMSSAAPAVQV